MTDTKYQIIGNGVSYNVRITRLGSFIQEAEGFATIADAEAWIAQDQRIAALDERKEPRASAHLKTDP